MKTIGILGSTGSVGTQALDVLREHKNYQVEYLSCFNQIDKIVSQAKELRPKKVCIIDQSKESILLERLKIKISKYYLDLKV